MAKNKQFQVTSRFVLLLNANITAESLEAAAARADSLKWEDYGLEKLDCIDGKGDVVSVSDVDGYDL